MLEIKINISLNYGLKIPDTYITKRVQIGNDKSRTSNEKKIIERNEPLTLRFICTMRLRQSQHTLPIEPTGNW